VTIFSHTQSENPMDPWDHMSFFPWEGHFPCEALHYTWEPTSHEDISCESGHIPWGSHVKSHHLMWLTWDGLYPMGKVFISHRILFPCERQSHVKDLISCGKYFPMGNIFPSERLPRKYLPEEKTLMWNNILPCNESKKGEFSLKITYYYAYHSFI